MMVNLVIVIRGVGIERIGRLLALPGLHLSFELLPLRLDPALLLGRDQVEPVELVVLESLRKLLKTVLTSSPMTKGIDEETNIGTII